jgi:hypothetical protein
MLPKLMLLSPCLELLNAIDLELRSIPAHVPVPEGGSVPEKKPLAALPRMQDSGVLAGKHVQKDLQAY